MDTMVIIGALTLAAEPWSVGTARRYVRWLLREEKVDPAEMEQVVSELVTNAVTHGAGRVALLLALGASAVRVEVADEGGGGEWRVDADPLSEHGRGLMLVEALSKRWGVERRADRTCVWAEATRK